jgi:hypothetical protein
MSPKVINSVLFAYSLVMAGMGIEAYLVKGSFASLAGVLFGILMIASVAVWKSNPRAGRIFSLIVALAGTSRPLMKLKDLTFYPGGVILGISLVAILVLGMGHMMTNSAKNSAGN